ncbi:MAG: hypothetical protein ACOYD0_13110 [Candidatus Nanopelagicales bacterium]
MWRRHLATWAVVTVLALLINVPSSSASGTSITSPGAAAAVGVSDEAWAAFLAGHGELTGASVAAPVAGTVATAAAAAASLEISSPGLLGKATALLGGFGKWFLGIDDKADLPAGAGGAGASGVFGSAPYTQIKANVSLSAPLLVGTTASLTVAGTNVFNNPYGIATTGVRLMLRKSSTGATWFCTSGAQLSFGGSAGSTGSGTISCPGVPLATGYDTIGVTPGTTAHGTFTGSSWQTDPGWLPLAGGPPLRHVEQTITCKNAAGDLQTITSNSANALWETGDIVEVAAAMCPLGSRAVGVVAKVKTEGGTDLTVIDQPYSPGSPLDAGTADIPEPCYSGTTCHLELERVTDPTGESWEKVDPATVPDWWADPVRDQVYRCVYGAGASWIVLPITACEVYSNPTSSTPAKPTSSTPTDNDPTGDCEFGWGDLFNGGIFVRGSKCVLRWAFIPEAGFAPVMGRFSAGWSGSGIGAWITETGGAGSAMGGQLAAAGSVGCEGPTYAVQIGEFDGDLKPFSTCSEPFQTIAPIVKALLGMLLVFAGVRSILRRITRATDMPNAPGA